MIKHVVTFTLKDMSPEQEEKLLAAFRALDGQIPEVKSFTMGRNISDRDQTYTHCLVSEFEDMEAVGRYLKHPAHVAAIEEHLAPVMERRAVIDYEV